MDVDLLFYFTEYVITYPSSNLSECVLLKGVLVSRLSSLAGL